MPSKVLRRSQLGLKTEEPPDGDAKKPGPKGSKPPGRPKGKAKAKAGPKREAAEDVEKVKGARKRTAAKSKSKQANSELPVGDEDEANGADHEPFLKDDAPEDPAKEAAEPEKPEPAAKRQKKAAPPADAGGAKSSKGKKRDAEPEPEEDAKTKKQRGKDGPSTFARRALPATEFGKSKWYALRSAFERIIKPLLSHHHVHEDCICRDLLSCMGNICGVGAYMGKMPH